MIIELILIAVLSGVITHKHSKYTRIMGSGLITYVVLAIYWAYGIYYNNEYEPEMLLGWFLMSTVGNFLVIPLSYFLGNMLLRFQRKAT
ncbi:hypothetical protein [Colwellia sp. MB02u-14]|uniref:hypothetical protein n=1 Tax=Colwellia sp. MB02u-14 TaxID=2759815 RepID=UPI0015F6DBFB|nr:hypothetical protein [Colwellia sp. MB02u-14]MBA6302330.1 hypothetical protein [Colwellia sp. MB02u-14]